MHKNYVYKSPFPYLLIAIFLIAFAGVIFVRYYTYQTQTQRFRERARDQLSLIAESMVVELVQRRVFLVLSAGEGFGVRMSKNVQG